MDATLRQSLPGIASRTHGALVMIAACALSACSDAPPQPESADDIALAQRGASSVIITALPARDTLGFGAVMQLGAEAFDGNGRTVEAQPLVWRSSDTTVATVSVAGIVITGQREGTVRLRARVGDIEGQRLLTVRARANRYAESSDTTDATVTDNVPPVGGGPWTFCASINTICEYVGLRDVRLVLAGGTTMQQTAFGRVSCTADAFRERNTETGRALRCEYGPIRRRALVNPMPSTFGMGATIVVPVGAAGSGEPRRRPSPASGRTPDGSGSFRTRCAPASFQFNDPLGNQGQSNRSPLHVFFGNSGVNASTRAAMLAEGGNSTCRGGTLDRSVYYVPALIDTRNGEVQMPADGVMYYRTGYDMEPVTIEPMPAGLVLMAGDRNARGVQQRAVEWLCRDKFVTNTGTIPDCGVGDQVQLWVHFPQCWDGRNLDSRDHRSHMAYPVVRHRVERSRCPSSHPVPLPQISQLMQYDVRAGASLGRWRLSTDAYGSGLRGGLSAHAHWLNGWNPSTMRTMVTACLHDGRDCNTSSLGDGTTLF